MATRSSSVGKRRWHRSGYRAVAASSWLDEAGATAGSFVEFQVPELTSTSTAEVISVEACPELSAGPGRLVTATYRHESAEIIDVTVEGCETIGTTANHPFWCVNTQSFIEADLLEVGQQLESIDGTTVSITSITPRGPPESVFNVEVDFEHVYFVGDGGFLVHNAKDYSFSGKLGEVGSRLNEAAKNLLRRGRAPRVTLRHGTDLDSANDIVRSGLNRQRATDLGGGDTFWATRNGTDADFFARANPAGGQPAVVRIELDQKVVESLQRQGLLDVDGDVFRFNGDAWDILNEFGRFFLD